MGRLVKIGTGYRNIALPNGQVLSADEQTTLSDAQWASIPLGEVGTMIIDLGAVTDTSNLLVLDASEDVPDGTAAGTVIVRRAT